LWLTNRFYVKYSDKSSERISLSMVYTV